MNYYNEFDPKAAAWLRELMKAKLIPDGKVDERSICDVQANDLKGFTQCHFFAGIGGWSYALRLAGWPESRPVWTGSCPCQPFSTAGKQQAETDERHVWPWFFGLIGECDPAIVFGEQVASKLGRQWFSGVRTDLESLGYAVGCADLCAPCVRAPHIRQRLFWVGDAENANGWAQQSAKSAECGRGRPSRNGGMADSTNGRRTEHVREPRRRLSPAADSAKRSGANGVAYAIGTRLEERNIPAARKESATTQRNSPDFWNDCEFIPCADGKARRIKSGLQPLAHGIPGRVGLLRGYGNAIVPAVAAEFILAYEGGA